MLKYRLQCSSYEISHRYITLAVKLESEEQPNQTQTETFSDNDSDLEDLHPLKTKERGWEVVKESTEEMR